MKICHQHPKIATYSMSSASICHQHFSQFFSTTVQMPVRIFDRKSYTKYPKSDIFDQNRLKNIEVISK